MAECVFPFAACDCRRGHEGSRREGEEKRVSEGAEKYEKIVSAARELLAAMDRTIFYDLGTEEPFPDRWTEAVLEALLRLGEWFFFGSQVVEDGSVDCRQ